MALIGAADRASAATSVMFPRKPRSHAAAGAMFPVPRRSWLRCPAAWSLTCSAPWPGSSPKPSSTPPTWPGHAAGRRCLQLWVHQVADRRPGGRRQRPVDRAGRSLDGGCRALARTGRRAAGAASGGSQVAPVRFPAPATAEAAWPGLRCQGRDLRPSPQVL